ncbi:hypothetical protein ElyMa_004886400 [Elysia marginata]|uniref:Uncharacterized protein n=1 Tax=Elysia marginata TaxID=1093978 RepID=A0AAV4IYC4_9GAST|nr:hypothetical protein ElyMa_004886400 [Elysia marginata]
MVSQCGADTIDLASCGLWEMPYPTGRKACLFSAPAPHLNCFDLCHHLLFTIDLKAIRAMEGRRAPVVLRKAKWQEKRLVISCTYDLLAETEGETPNLSSRPYRGGIPELQTGRTREDPKDDGKLSGMSAAQQSLRPGRCKLVLLHLPMQPARFPQSHHCSRKLTRASRYESSGRCLGCCSWSVKPHVPRVSIIGHMIPTYLKLWLLKNSLPLANVMMSNFTGNCRAIWNVLYRYSMVALGPLDVRQGLRVA